MTTTPTMERTSSSHELARAARKRLKSTSYLGIRGLSCECDDRGVLYLRGRLSSYYQKQLAQETVLAVCGVAQVVNEVVVN